MSEEQIVLFVRHLPVELDANEQGDLLKHFGAIAVRSMGVKGRFKHTAFATFDSEEAARKALGRLHQLEVLDRKLSVEFAKPQHRKQFPHLSEENVKERKKEENVDKDNENITKINNQDSNLNTDTTSHIAPSLNIDYPVNPKLRYMYPPPDVNILTNIANAIATVPKFYVQVLHLMNRMNLPAPFGPLTPMPPIPEGPPPQARTKGSGGLMEMSSTEESEIESDGEHGKSNINGVKRKMKQDLQKPRKKHKIQHIVSAPKDAANIVKPDEVFEQMQGQAQKKIEFKLTAAIVNVLDSNPASQPSSTIMPTAQSQPVDVLNVVESQSVHDNETEEVSGFGKIEPVAKEAEPDEEKTQEENMSKFISSRDLRHGRISSKEMKSINVFKNYNSGDPTTRLYIKNLAKQTTDSDLMYIFGRYINWESEDEKNMFDIRHMKEGRMKGQAFVTLPNEQISEQALTETNGFILHSKPMVVQFARSAKPKESDKSKNTSK